jgi:hypothetical protein
MANLAVGDSVPGKNVREVALERYSLRLLLGAVFVVIAFCVARKGLSARNLGELALFLCALVITDFFINGVLRRLVKRQVSVGRAEAIREDVGTLLDRLPAGCAVLRDVVLGQGGTVGCVVFRRDGAVFVLEVRSVRGRVSEQGGELRVNGRPFEIDLMPATQRSVFWLRDFLAGQLGFQPWINAAIVFPNAQVSVRRTLRGIDVVSGHFFPKWMSKARGNAQAKTLWADMGRLKRDLLAEGKRG